MLKRSPLVMSVLSGLILWAAWPTSPLTFLVFFGLVPLIFVAERVEKRSVYFGLLFLAFWIFNTGTTWWVGNTTVPASGIFANAFNALLMTIPWLLYQTIKQRAGKVTGYFALVMYWLAFEYIHQEWELSWPWLTLGNAFAMRPDWVQWYEYTGTSGGTAWVLLMNILVYEVLLFYKKEPGWFFLWKEGWKPVLLLLFPLFISWLVFQGETYEGKDEQVGVVIVQPNIDPYEEKYAAGGSMEQVRKFLALTAQQIDSSTRYIVWPETALFPTGAWEHALNDQQEVQMIRQFLTGYPKAKLVSGASTFKRYLATDEIPSTARFAEGDIYYDAFNSAIQIDTSAQIQVYHKAKLVPGVELTPYMRFLPFMKKLALDMGGITGSYGLTPGVPIFTDAAGQCNVFAAICYESVYGNFVAEKVKAGANLLIVVTNDGWWGDTEGHRQHFQYARLRAIETRRWVARSANTGISGVIAPSGAVITTLPYWHEGVINNKLTCRNELTWYTEHYVLISSVPLYLSLLLIIYSVSLMLIRRRHGKNI